MSSFSSKFLVAVLAVFVLVASIAAAQGSNCQVPNCQSCGTTEYSCATCESGYVLNAGQCSPPTYCGVTSCDTCVVGNPRSCASCSSGYRLTTSGLCARVVKNGAAAPAAAMWAAAAAAAVAVAYAL